MQTEAVFECGEFSPFHEEIWRSREMPQRSIEDSVRVHSWASQHLKNRTYGKQDAGPGPPSTQEFMGPRGLVSPMGSQTESHLPDLDDWTLARTFPVKASRGRASFPIHLIFTLLSVLHFRLLACATSYVVWLPLAHLPFLIMVMLSGSK